MSQRVALVTGGASGIGRACVRQLAARGYLPVLMDLNDEAGRAVVSETPGAHFVRGDAASDIDVRRAVEAAAAVGGGDINALVNNAGRTLRKAFAEVTPEEWDQVLAVNAKSVFLATRAALPALVRARGAVVTISSVAGQTGEEGLAVYSASKAALIALTRSLALEYGDRVRFNVVCPGQIDTPMMSRVTRDPTLLREVEARIPAGHLGDPQDVARAVAWLLSDEAAFVNGATLTIDGGETAGIRASAARPESLPR